MLNPFTKSSGFVKFKKDWYIYIFKTHSHQKETKNVFIRIYQNYQQDDIYYVRTIHMKDLFGYIVKIEKRSLEKQMKSSKRRFTGIKL